MKERNRFDQPTAAKTVRRRPGRLSLIPAFLLGYSAISEAQVLPKIDIPEEWRSCREAEDCTFITEACRSCEGIVLNKRFVEAYTALDQRLRKEANFSAKCEACSNSAWKIICSGGRCLSMIEMAGASHRPAGSPLRK